MSNKDKKRKHGVAIKAEMARREQDRRDRSLLSRDNMLNLLSFVGEKIMTEGHTHDFSFTIDWLQKNSFDENSAMKFFSDENIVDDWSVCTEGDPYSLFGPSEDRLSWMPLKSSQLESLIEWLDEKVSIKGCNRDLSLTTKWLKANNFPVHPALMALLVHGGGCDCEVVMNVEIEGIYP